MLCYVILNFLSFFTSERVMMSRFAFVPPFPKIILIHCHAMIHKGGCTHSEELSISFS
jgi:hypothetical protein